MRAYCTCGAPSADDPHFNFKQVGGRTSDKGGHELDGRTYFDRPAVPTPVFAIGGAA